MEQENSMGQVLPFARDAKYLRKAAARKLEKGEPIQALELLRLARGGDPDDLDTLTLTARVYSEMRCPALSNRALFALLQREKNVPESLYRAGCNFLMLSEPELAKDCLLLSLQQQPGSEFAPDAIELLTMLDEDLHMHAQIESRVNRRMDRVLRALTAQKPQLAIRLSRRVLALDRLNASAQALLSLALLSNGDQQGALRAARQAIRISRTNVHALCAMAMATHTLHSSKAALTYLVSAISAIEGEEDLRLVLSVACDLEAHDLVQMLCQRPENAQPLSEDLQHVLAVAAYNTGNRQEAQRRFKLIRRINPMDSTANWALHGLSKGQLPEDLPYDGSLPSGAVLERLTRLRKLLESRVDAFHERRPEGDELEALLRWGLASGEAEIARTVVSVLASLSGPRAESILLDTFGDLSMDDATREHAAAVLFSAGNAGPFYLLRHGRLAHVSILRQDAPDPMTPASRAMARAVLRRLGRCTAQEAQAVNHLCSRIIELHPDRDLRLRARVVEMACRRRRGETVDFPQKPARRREMARLLRQFMKETQHDEMHQL